MRAGIMTKWRCGKNNCTVTGDGEPMVWAGRFYCPEHHPNNNWVVIGYKHHERACGLSRALFEVHQNDRTVKDAQDGIAEYAGEHPEIIYTVVNEADYRGIFRDILDNFFGKKN
jgi:hypothetical protein